MRKLVQVPGICGGRWTFEGTRIGVAQVGLLRAQGSTIEELLDHFPSLASEDIATADKWVTQNPGLLFTDECDRLGIGLENVVGRMKLARRLAIIRYDRPRQ